MDREKIMKENYRYTEDGVLLVRKIESEKIGSFDTMFGCKEMWYQCSEENPNGQFLKVVLGGWFGLHKFMERSWLQGLFYLLTCGCFGVFYFCDLLSIFCANYFYRKVTYIDEGMGIERRMQKIYYAPLEDKKQVVLLLLLAIVILILALFFVYQPVGNFLIEWLTTLLSEQITEKTAEQMFQLFY